jgi:uncharacterized protein
MLIEQEWILTPQRVAVHVPTVTGVVADLHLGYHAARRRRGEATPQPALTDILAPLGDVLCRFAVNRLVVAGDLFEDGFNEPLAEEFCAWLRQRDAQVLALVPGNHDRNLDAGDSPWPVFSSGYPLGRWQIVHGDRRLPAPPTVSGHWHPAMRVNGRYYPCYLHKPGRLILPAFSQDARGVSLGGGGWRGYRCLTPVGKDVLDFGPLGRVQRELKLHRELPANRRRKLAGNQETHGPSRDYQ